MLMPFLIKSFITLAIIILCTRIGQKFPSLGGLIATMPLASLMVLIWLYMEQPTNYHLMKDYVRGALWGIGPSILFFMVAYACFRRQLPFGMVLSASFGAWVIGAFIHQWFLR